MVCAAKLYSTIVRDGDITVAIRPDIVALNSVVVASARKPNAFGTDPGDDVARSPRCAADQVVRREHLDSDIAPANAISAAAGCIQADEIAFDDIVSPDS